MFAAYAALVWVLFLLAAIGLGGLRDRLFAPRLGEARARRILTVVLCLVILLVTREFVRATGLTDPVVAWRVGLGWTLATALFETVMARWGMGRSWRDIGLEYAFWRGRWWILVPACTLAAPVVAVSLAG